MHSNLVADHQTFSGSMDTHPIPPESLHERREPSEVEAAPAAQITAIAAENRDLRAQLDQARADRSRLLDAQRSVMELLGTANPDKILHDLRNLLNERDLLKALVDEM
jgi:hypothetical protein